MPEKKFTKIYFRVFPAERMFWDYVKILDDYKTVYVRCLQSLTKSKDKVTPTFWTFQADHVFYDESQQEIFDCVMPDVLSNLSQGLDAIIVAYGQTGTGKSLTINGVRNSYEGRGILPRVIPMLFDMKKRTCATENLKACIHMSFIEMANTTVRDLLKPYPCIVSSLKDITKMKVKTEDETLEYIFRGEGRKEFSENPSYSSHSFSSVCTFHITTKDSSMQDHQIHECKLHVIDLAGVDTVGNFSCMFKKPREVGSANLIKSQLEQFFLVLSTNIPNRIKVKYRINPMIQYLGDSLNNTNMLRFIGHIKTFRENLLVTLSMLRFGELVGGLKASKYEINIDNKDLNLEKIYNLQDSLSKLNKKNSLLVRENLEASFNADRFAHVQRTINEYLQDKITEVTVLNVCEVSIALETLKLICKKLEEEKGQEIKVPPMTSSMTDQKMVKTGRLSGRTSSSSLLKRRSGEKIEKRHSASLPLKAQESLRSQTKSKTSRSSLIRRAGTGKRGSVYSQSSILKDKNKMKTDPADIIPTEIPPEYSEAWDMYKVEKSDDYKNFVVLYEKHETDAKIAYKTYVKEMEDLKEIVKNVEQIKNELFLAQMTRELLNVEKKTALLSNLERCHVDQMRQLENAKVEKREIILTNQAMFKVSLTVCKQISKDLKDDFEDYCKEKYQMPILENSLDEAFTIVTKIDDVTEEEGDELEELLPEDSGIEKFQQFKRLITIEEKKKRLYIMKHKEWTFY